MKISEMTLYGTANQFAGRLKIQCERRQGCHAVRSWVNMCGFVLEVTQFQAGELIRQSRIR